MLHLNSLVVFITAMSTYVVAGIWYSPGIFGKIWHRESRDPRPYTPSRPFPILFSGFILSAVSVIAFANTLGMYPTLGEAVGQGLYVGVFFLATAFGIHYQFTNHSLKLWLIDGGFRALQFAVFGWLLAWLLTPGFDPVLHTPAFSAEPAFTVLNRSEGYGRFPAVVFAAVAGLLLRWLWYSPVGFGKIWVRADAGRQQLRINQSLRTFGVGLIFSLVSAAAFAKWLGTNPPLPYALQQGLLVGVGFVAVGIAINYLCANHSWKMYLIDCAGHVAQYLVYALILGLWH